MMMGGVMAAVDPHASRLAYILLLQYQVDQQAILLIMYSKCIYGRKYIICKKIECGVPQGSIVGPLTCMQIMYIQLHLK